MKQLLFQEYLQVQQVEITSRHLELPIQVHFMQLLHTLYNHLSPQWLKTNLNQFQPEVDPNGIY